MAWRLADAKNRFSEVVNRALTGDPQLVLRRHCAAPRPSRHDPEHRRFRAYRDPPP